VVGQLGQVRPRVGRVQVLQRLRGAPVQAHPAGGGQPLVEHLADQRMGEAPAAEAAGDLGDHPRRLRLLEQLEQAVAAQAAGRLQGAQLELAAEDGGGLQHPVAAVGEAAEPLGDHRPDTLREAGRQRRRARPGVAEPALAGEQADHLGHEERVAVGLPVHGGRQPRRRLDAADQGDEAGDVALVQTAQQHPAVAPAAGQVGEGRQQRMPAVHLGMPVGAEHQRAGALEVLAHEPQRRQRGRVGPVEVVEDQQQRPLGGGRPEEAGEAVEQPEPGRLRLHRRRCRQLRQALADGGDELGDVGRAGAHLAAERRRVAALHVGADDLDPRPERGRTLPSQQRPHRTAAPRAAAAAATSSASRVLPMPASPASSTTPPRPPAAASRSVASAASSVPRPTNGVVTADRLPIGPG
jgi:hypothetical protein